jgi:hypothetical protein
MTRVRPLARQVLFLLFSLFIAVFLQFRSQAANFTFVSHAYRPGLGQLILFTALTDVLLVGIWALFAQILTKACAIPYKEAISRDFLTYVPLLFLALTPIALIHYLTSTDLLKRWALSLAAVFAAVAYLKAAQAVRLLKDNPAPWLQELRKFFTLRTRTQSLLLFAAALLVFNVGSLIITSRGTGFSGDEPHYLLITHSLLRDKDFDLANNYARRDYDAFMPPGTALRSHTVAGKKPGSEYSFHSPGVAVFLLPFYFLGTLLGRGALIFLIRFGMSIAGALFTVQVYLYAHQEWNRDRLALAIWFLAAFTSPVFFYSIHVYPEILIALFSLAAFRLLRFSRSLTIGRLLLLGFLLSSFIWFHALKYFFLIGPLFLFALWVLIVRHRERLRLAYFAALPAIGAGLYFFFQYSFYGSLNPTSVSWQGAMDAPETVRYLKTLLTGIPFRFRLETLAGYFLDQRDGLLFYAPIYLFSFLGALELVRRKRGSAALLFFLAAPYILVSAFLTQRTGYAPQARPLVAAVWVLIIGLGYFLAENGKKIFSYLANLAAGLSVLVVVILCFNPRALYQETTQGTIERGGDLFYLLSHLHFYLPRILPSFIKVEDWHWLPNFIWPPLVVLFVAAYIASRKRDFSLRFGHHLALTLTGLALFFAWFVLFPRITLVPPRTAILPTGEKVTFYALSRVARMQEPARFSLLEDNRDYHFYFASARPFHRLNIQYGSVHGAYELKLGLFDMPVFDEQTDREIKEKMIEAPAAYAWKGLSLYLVTVHLERQSDVRTGINPYLLRFQPLR